MITAGLTGSIATGKSTVANIFAEAGAIVIDADKIARAVVRKNQPAWQDIVDHFGREILAPDGELNREALGEIIFNDSKAKQALNQIVHPHVMRTIDERLVEIARQQPASVVIVDVPLLIEIGMHKNMPEVIVVYVPEELQLERLMRRDGLSRQAAMARIESQMPIDEKKALASIVIDNSGSLTQTRRRTLQVYDRLLASENKQPSRQGEF